MEENVGADGGDNNDKHSHSGTLMQNVYPETFACEEGEAEQRENERSDSGNGLSGNSRFPGLDDGGQQTVNAQAPEREPNRHKQRRDRTEGSAHEDNSANGGKGKENARPHVLRVSEEIDLLHTR